MKKKMGGGTELNAGKHRLRAFDNPVGLSMYDSPMETVFINRWVPLRARSWLVLVAKVSVGIATSAEFLEPLLLVILMYA